MKDMKIYSAAVAVTLKDGKEVIIPCHRHGDVFGILGELGIERKRHLDRQGFLSSAADPEDKYNVFYTFIDRKEAKRLALVNGQYKGSNPEDPELYSEDLW